MERNHITHEEHHSGQFTSSPNLHLEVSRFWDERRDAEPSHPFRQSAASRMRKRTSRGKALAE